MNKRVFALLLSTAMLLCGCAQGSAWDDGDAVNVYRFDPGHGGSILVREKIKMDSGETSLEAIIEALNSEPNSQELERAFSEDVKIESVSVHKGVADVSMSQDYLYASGLEMLLAESAIVLSLSTLNEVCSVNISCMGNTMTEGLVAEDYMEADGLCGSYERSLKLYLPNDGYEFLEPETVQSFETEGASIVEAMLREIFREIGGGVEDTKLISADISEGVCRIELSQEFYGTEPAGSSEGRLIIYSVVNSLCRIPGVDFVTVTVEGIDIESYGDFAAVWPMEADMSLVKYQE